MLPQGGAPLGGTGLDVGPRGLASQRPRLAPARQLLANAAITASRLGSHFGARPHWNSVFSVAPEQALGPLGKGLGRYLPFRIVGRRHLCSAVKSRMDAQY